MRPSIRFTAVLIVTGVLPLAAQDPVAGDSIDPVTLREVNVSIVRTPLPLARTPFAISVSRGTDLGPGRPGLALDEALRAVPGVQVDNRYNYALGERISIRGFGARAQFGVRGVRVLVDGVPATFPDGQTSLSHLDLAYLSRAEVIRGPASSLYGGSSGGVLQLETSEPAPGERVREAGLIAGSHQLLRAQAAVGAGSDAGSYLLRISHQGYGGERDFSDARNLRAHASGRLASPLGDLRISATAVDYRADNPGSLSETLLAEDRTQAYANNVAQRTGEEGRQAQLGAALTRVARLGQLELAGYLVRREVLNPIPATVIDLARSVAGLRGLYRASTGTGTLSVGAEAAVQRDDRQNFVNDGGSTGAATLDQAESVDNFALFGQAALTSLETFTLLGGLRYDWYRFGADDRFVDGDPDDSGEIDMAALSPSVGASIRLADRLDVYANVATAFETPTTTELANRPDGAGGFNPDLEPQKALSFEAGIKGGVLDVASYELAAYTAEVSNALIPFEVETMPDRQFFRNAGSVRHRGVEAGARVAPTRWFQARGAYTLTDARFLSYARADQVFDGNRVPGIAPHRADLVFDVNAGRPFLGVDIRYASRTTVDDANSAHSPSYVVADLRAGVREVRLSGIEAEPVLGLSNLFDTEYNSSVVVNAFGRRYFEPAPGRALHVGLRVRF